MASEQIRGSLNLLGGGQLPGGFSTGKGGTSSKPPVPITSPQTFAVAGVHVFGVPAGVQSLTVEQWSGGGGGTPGDDANTGGHGGGGGSYAKYTLARSLLQPGGIVTVTVGAGGASGTLSGNATKCVPSGNDAVFVQCNGGIGGLAGGGASSVTTNAGTGLAVATTTPGSAGSAAAGKVGGAGGAGASGGAGGAGGADTKNGTAGTAPGGGGGGGGGSSTAGGAGAAGKVVISWS